MKNLYFVLILTLSGLFLAGCHSSQQTAEVRNDNKTADTTFARLTDEFLEGFLAWRPQLGTSLGLHQYDGKLTNFSKTSLEEELVRLRYYEQQLAALDTTRLNRQQFMDYRLLRAAIGKEIFTFEELRSYSVNPMTYAEVLDLNIYVQRDFASLEDRMRSIIAIEEMAPHIFAAARENLADSLAKPYTETAIEIARGSAEFLEKELATALESVKNDSLAAAFAVSNQKAITERTPLFWKIKKFQKRTPGTQSGRKTTGKCSNTMKCCT